MRIVVTRYVDLSKVREVVYHFSDGQPVAVPVEEFEGDFDPGYGRICDTSGVDGLLHYFPRGNA